MDISKSKHIIFFKDSEAWIWNNIALYVILSAQ